MSPKAVRTKHPSCCGYEQPATSRRDFLQRSSIGFGWLAYAGLSSQWAMADSPNATSGTPHSLLHHAPLVKPANIAYYTKASATCATSSF